MCFFIYYYFIKQNDVKERTPKNRIVFTKRRKNDFQVEYNDNKGVAFFVDPIYIYDYCPIVIFDIDKYNPELYYNGENGI